jgi:hypothetical protein
MARCSGRNQYSLKASTRTEMSTRTKMSSTRTRTHVRVPAPQMATHRVTLTSTSRVRVPILGFPRYSHLRSLGPLLCVPSYIPLKKWAHSCFTRRSRALTCCWPTVPARISRFWTCAFSNGRLYARFSPAELLAEGPALDRTHEPTRSKRFWPCACVSQPEQSRQLEPKQGEEDS